MSFVIFDTEYTTWKGCQENGWTGNQKRELVQIGALKISDDLQVIKELNIFCKPVINPVVSDYFTELSGITNEFIQEHGITFPEFYEKFKEFVGSDTCYSFGWGGNFLTPSDGAIIEENLKLNKMPEDKTIKYRNIAWWFQQVFLKHHINVVSINSGKIAKTIGIEEELASLGLNEHNALYDVYSILSGIKYYKKDWFSFLKHN